jgi:FaeA-like protein
MRIVLQTLWHLLEAIALLITVVVGGLTIVEKVRAMGGGFFRDLIAFRVWRIAKRVLAFMKRTNAKNHYTVDEIAVALRLSIRQTWSALENLQAKGKVDRRSVDQATGGALWTLNELER